MAWILLLASCLTLYWIYDGYGRFLAVVVRVLDWRTNGPVPVMVADSDLPTLTVLLTVHNEEQTVVSRLQNLLACDYPEEKMQILVASDRSSDRTDELVESLGSPRIKCFRSTGPGKTATQNAALSLISSDIIVFTDAGTVFDRIFLKRIANCFADTHVGGAAGYLLFDALDPNANVRSQGYYWAYELKLRTLESRLGLLAVVAGAAFAARRSLMLPMDPSVGEDCIVPLDVVSQGFRVVHERRAIAHEQFGHDTGVTLRSRIRMTLRNWQGTWSRPRLLNPLRNPGYAFALWSHKLLRWLSPLFLVLAMASATWLVVFQPGPLSWLAAVPFVGLFGMAGLGAMGQPVPGAGASFSFLMANLAFSIGVLRAICGNRVFSYRNV